MTQPAHASSSAPVAAVLGSEEPLALAEQTRAPTHVFAGDDALARALDVEARWLWLLAAGGRPRADALERLLHASDDRASAAALVSGAVLDAAGRPLEDELPAVRHGDVASVIALSERRLAPIRHATFANCLVERTAFARHGLPDARSFGRHAAVEWTARVLRDRPGRFCPASVVVVGVDRTGPGPPLAEIGATIRTLRSGAWTRGESVRELLQLASAIARGSRG
jgi:hypothetical protein